MPPLGLEVRTLMRLEKRPLREKERAERRLLTLNRREGLMESSECEFEFALPLAERL